MKYTRLEYQAMATGFVIVCILFVSIFVTIQNLQHTTQLAHRIQEQRRSSAFMSCEQTNQRHDAAVTFLHHIALQQESAAKGNKAQIKAIQTAEHQYDALFQAMLPKQNCVEHARSTVS